MNDPNIKGITITIYNLEICLREFLYQRFNDRNNIFFRFEEYRKENDLDLILIIYKVSRKTKKITIREIYWLDNETLKNNEKVNIIKNNNNDLSVINIENTNVLKKLLVPSNNFILIQNYVNGLQKKIDNIFKYQLI